MWAYLLETTVQPPANIINNLQIHTSVTKRFKQKTLMGIRNTAPFSGNVKGEAGEGEGDLTEGLKCVCNCPHFKPSEVTVAKH